MIHLYIFLEANEHSSLLSSKVLSLCEYEFHVQGAVTSNVSGHCPNWQTYEDKWLLTKAHIRAMRILYFFLPLQGLKCIY